jgi:hypothetical protein
MRVLVSLMLIAFGPASSLDHATFRVDEFVENPRIAVATIGPRAGAAGYFWLRVHFYSSLTPAERRQAETGGVQAQRTHWAAVLQFGLDAQGTVGHIDMAVPGHTCTIAATSVDAQAVLQDFRFDGKTLTLRTKGVHICDLSLLHVANQRFEWDVDLDTPVIQSGSFQ